MKYFIIGYIIGFLSPFILFYGGFFIVGLYVAIKRLINKDFK